jgi:hypothetical protein
LKKDSNHLEKNVKITNGTWYYYFEWIKYFITSPFFFFY